MKLPDSFIAETRRTMGEERFAQFLTALGEEPPVSIRLNPWKVSHALLPTDAVPVPWCSEGFYLPVRPAFTFDPLLHAGCYYVQEASSMFVSHVLRQYVTKPVRMLDLCAAPGGKSTAARAVLPKDSLLVSNEPVRQRSQILSENIQKWGHPDCIVTNLYPKDFRKAKARFDVILCDVPCSGEGMFRKDPKAVDEWTMQNVEKCWRLQRDIVGEAWQCLVEGGLLIYSTCTYNILENEANVKWMAEELGGELLPVTTHPDWGITGSLLDGFDSPVYRFIPGFTKGEGLFMAALRKPCSAEIQIVSAKETDSFLQKNALFPAGKQEGNDSLPIVEVDYPTAISYLRGEALVLPPDTPRGLVSVAFQGHRLGEAKNIGNRANNLYPKEWRIKSTHIPKEYETILRLA